MVLDDTHIEYLKLVKAKKVGLWSAYRHGPSRYVCLDWANGRVEVDQRVAAQMHALGMTHVISVRGKSRPVIELTAKGEATLSEEDESWEDNS
jgi:hypothetical protein